MSSCVGSDSTPDSKDVRLCVHDYRAFGMVRAALQTAVAVVSSHVLLINSLGNGGSLCCLYLSGHPRPCVIHSSVFTLISSCVGFLRLVSCIFGGMRRASQPNSVFLRVFFSNLSIK